MDPSFLRLQNVSLVFNDFLAQLHVPEAFSTTMIYKYNSDTMKDLQMKDFQITPVVKQRINQLGINKQAMTRRGKRAGGKIQRPTQTVIGNTPNHHDVPCHPRPLPLLKSVQCNKPTQTATHPDNADVSKCEIPNFLLKNAPSIMNKCDELEIILNSSSPSPVDIAVVTETWQPDQVADEYIVIDGFNSSLRKEQL